MQLYYITYIFIVQDRAFTPTAIVVLAVVIFFVIFKNMFIDFREGRRERKRERERERETLIGCLQCAPQLGIAPAT